MGKWGGLEEYTDSGTFGSVYCKPAPDVAVLYSPFDPRLLDRPERGEWTESCEVDLRSSFSFCSAVLC